MAQSPELPLPVSYIRGRYLLFSVTAVSYIRREHNISGVLTGSLPQIPQQNVFLGLPLELMPEEAKLLVEKGVAYIVDDTSRHDAAPTTVREADKKAYLIELSRQGSEAARIQANRKEKKREAALQKAAHKIALSKSGSDHVVSQDGHAEESLFDSPSPQRPATPLSLSRSSVDIPTLAVTPATSRLLLPPEIPQSKPEIKAPRSYPLYAHLHSKGYFISPGLRFGCQYMAYPGDPLRFHSHFLTTGYGWDDEIDLMDFVGGGRLGTGVKKAFLVGGLEEVGEPEERSKPSVRTWSIEWAGM